MNVPLRNHLQTFMANMTRRLDGIWPGWTEGAKHNHYADFGFPVDIGFEQVFAMYQRNGLARGAVDKTVAKTWQDNPNLQYDESPDEAPAEKEVREHLTKINFFRSCQEADRRQLVGGYSGLILRFRDSQTFDQPVKRVHGLPGFIGAIPAWASQLTVSKWDTDIRSERYGEPTMFQFSEISLSTQTPRRSFHIHPDRVIIWSEDGTVNCESALLPGYNDLLTCEKIIGAGGEGFWKNARSAPVLTMDATTTMAAMAKAMQVSQEDLFEALGDQVEDFQKGFDKFLALQGMTASTLNVNLPSPEHYFLIALQSFAASVSIPLKELVGSQTGERASTEDARGWAQTNMSRRNNVVLPVLSRAIELFKRVGVFSNQPWRAQWTDLTEESGQDRVDRAAKMAEIHAKIAGTGEQVFTPDEIREVVGFEPLEVEETEGDQDEDPEGQD